MTPSLRTKRGSALLIAVTVLAIAGIGVAVVWQQLHTTLAYTQNQASSRQAAYLAEAGLDKAIALVRAQPGYAGETDTPLGEGRFSVQVTQTAPGHYRIVATGLLDRAKPRVLAAEATFDAQGRIISLQTLPKESAS